MQSVAIKKCTYIWLEMYANKPIYTIFSARHFLLFFLPKEQFNRECEMHFSTLLLTHTHTHKHTTGRIVRL